MRQKECEFKSKILSEIAYVKENIKKFNDEIGELENYLEGYDYDFVFYKNKERAVINNRISVLRNDLVKFRKILYGKD